MYVFLKGKADDAVGGESINVEDDAVAEESINVEDDAVGVESTNVEERGGSDEDKDDAVGDDNTNEDTMTGKDINANTFEDELKKLYDSDDDDHTGEQVDDDVAVP